jgi:ribonuclease P protein component
VRIKRTVRESFRLARAQLPAVDIVVQARSAAAQRESAELRKSLDWHWQEVIKRCKAS